MKKVFIGFLGCGNIGGGVWKLLSNMHEELKNRDGIDLCVKRVLVKDVEEAVELNRRKGLEVPREILTENAADVTGDPDISLVCEFMGGEHPASDFMLNALENGKSVVTANKVALALQWDKLQAAAEKNGVGLWFEAAVGGVIPVIRSIQTNLESDRIDRVMGIINGTTNYILTRMSREGKDYNDVLADAQRLGLAEPDPAADVEGMDSAYKLSILASLAFHGRVTYPRVNREGITKVTPEDISYGAEMGYVLKLLAIAKKDGNEIEVRVHPTFLPKDHPLAKVDGSLNAIFIHGAFCNDITLQGRGAGDMPTASAICGDLIEAVLSGTPRYPSFKNTAEDDPSFTFTDNWKTSAFIRLSVEDRPGVLSHVADCFAREGVSIATMMQKDVRPDGRVSLIFITHPAPEQALKRAVDRINGEICRLEQLIRVEN